MFEHVTMHPDKARWIGSGIPMALRGLTIDDVMEMGGRPEQAQLCREWVDNLPQQQHVHPETGIPTLRNTFGRGLFMSGLPGTGKTTLAIAVACEVRLAYRKSVFFVRFPSHMDTLRRLMHPGPSVDAEQLSRWYSEVESVENAHLVVLDDVGHEHRTDSKYAEDTLHDLVRRRYEAGSPTICISNLTGPQWAERYSSAFASFIKQACRRIEFPSDSLRE